MRIFKVICLASMLLLPISRSALAGEAEDLFSVIQDIAIEGNPTAQYNLGMFFNNGIGTKKNPVQAFEWFLRAAESGHPLGAYKVGCYYAGQFAGVVAVDAEKALKYKLIAAQAGYSLAQYDVASYFARDRNYGDAFEWLSMAANQGVESALYYLAVSYQNGMGIEQSNAKAYRFFRILDKENPHNSNQQVRTLIDELADELTVEELAAAEGLVMSWKPHRSSLTIEANRGKNVAVELAANRANQ